MASLSRSSVACTLLLGLLQPTLLWAQAADSGKEPSSSESKAPLPEDEAWKPSIQKSYSDSEKKAACRKYEGHYIAFYTEIYKVENCKRREVVDYDLTTKITSLGVTPVAADVMIKLELGKPIEELQVGPPRSCKFFEKKYVTEGGGDVFYVEDCKRHSFPDWESVLAHRAKRKRSQEPVLDLSRAEIESLPEGAELPSVLDKVFKDLLEGKAEVHVIPIDEACKGVNGKFVSYYSRLYKIEECKKREIDPELYTKKNPNARFFELSSEQWLSLPDGKPWKF